MSTIGHFGSMIRGLAAALILFQYIGHVSTSFESVHASTAASERQEHSSPYQNADIGSRCSVPTLPAELATYAEAKKHGQEWRVHILERSLSGRGQHRELSTHMQILSVNGEVSDETECSRGAGGVTEVEEGCASRDGTGSCGQWIDGQRLRVAIWQNLPSGVFADPFELKRIHLRGGVEVQVRGAVDLESSAPDSCPTATWTQFQVPLVPQENGQLAAGFEWSLPLHSRYPVSEQVMKLYTNGPPSCLMEAVEQLHPSHPWTCHHSHAKVTIPLPRLFSASAKGPNSTHIEVENPMLVSEPILWLVPAGCASHKELVKSMTDISALMGAVVFIALLSWRNQSRELKGERML